VLPAHAGQLQRSSRHNQVQVGGAENRHQGTLPDRVVPLEHNRLIVKVLALDVPLVQIKLVKVQEQLRGRAVVLGGVGG
jgi:hypothetical protein